MSHFLVAMWKVFLLRFSWGIFPIPTTIHCHLVQLCPSFTILGIMWFIITVVAINRKKKKKPGRMPSMLQVFIQSGKSQNNLDF